CCHNDRVRELARESLSFRVLTMRLGEAPGVRRHEGGGETRTGQQGSRLGGDAVQEREELAHGSRSPCLAAEDPPETCTGKVKVSSQSGVVQARLEEMC